MSARPTQLIDGATGEIVDALLHDGLTAQDLLLVERAWSDHRVRIMSGLLRAGVARRAWPQSLHWDWGRKLPELRLLATAVSGVECLDQWQALMVTKTGPLVARLDKDRGRPIVYVDFLEVAPWNWQIQQIQQCAKLRACGSVMLRAAVEQGLREGFHGRVGLHSLPQAEVFYERCGMTRVGADASKDDLAYFEFDRESAQRFLERRLQ